MRAAAVCALLGACSVTETAATRPEPLAPLPPPAQAETDRFRDAEACGQCHLVKDDTPVLHDTGNTNVSPVLLWRSSMMANAARDPYYLAVFAEEIAANPSKQADIEAVCTRCHAPAGTEEMLGTGGHLSYSDMTSGTSPAAVLARGGVTCTLCHQIGASGLGEDTTFTGKFAVGYGRKIFGPYGNPLTNPMMLIVDYEPTFGDHINSAGLCATCHTVIVPTPSGEVVEQATFLEWRASSFSPSKPCQTCHVPRVDDQGRAIETVVSSFPTTLQPRTPVGRHTFVGANSYMLNILADGNDWANTGVDAAELTAAAARDEAHVQSAARVSIRDTHRDGDTLVFTVRVENLAGHKIPTGYPSRRMWLHVTAGGFESGAPTNMPRAQPHYDTISSPTEVQIYEGTLVDLNGNPTHRALDARRYSKDNRILPMGFNPTISQDKTRTAPLGTVGDANFVGGSDDVTYRLSGVPAGAAISVELLFTSLRPENIDQVEAGATPAGTRFVDLARQRPITPITVATAATTAP